jgi:hypothetical protein
MYNVKVPKIHFKDVLIYHSENITVILLENAYNYSAVAVHSHQLIQEL